MKIIIMICGNEDMNINNIGNSYSVRRRTNMEYTVHRTEVKKGYR